MKPTQLDVGRHMSLFDPYSFQDGVTVIGAGATGSWLVLQLAKLGITNITVYDFDIVEEHNIPNQLFGIQHIGMPKVDALASIIEEYTGTKIVAKNERFEKQALTGYVFLMVDSMSARWSIWTDAVKYKTQVKLLVEPRMGLNEGRVYNVNPMDIANHKAYEACWYPDDEAEVSACGTSQSVITTALYVASVCARQLINHVNQVELSNEILIDMVYNQVFENRW
jgi:molybdopterin/thiamine biosynthesis adenylyltransferase